MLFGQNNRVDWLETPRLALTHISYQSIGPNNAAHVVQYLHNQMGCVYTSFKGHCDFCINLSGSQYQWSLKSILAHVLGH